MKHAILSPSSGSMWSACSGALALAKHHGLDKRTPSAHADCGTVTHYISAASLEKGDDPVAFSGLWGHVDAEGTVTFDSKAGNDGFLVDQNRVRRSQQYVEAVRGSVEQGDTLLVEHRVPISHITQEPDAEGTCDALVLKPNINEIHVHDLKDGHGKVQAGRNFQLMMYAAGAVEKYGMAFDIDRVALWIHQPRIEEAPEVWCCTISELNDFVLYVQKKAAEVWKDFQTLDQGGTLAASRFNPGDTQCRWCTAKAECPALTEMVRQDFGYTEIDSVTLVDTVAQMPLTTLAEKRASIGLIRQWCDAVEERTEQVLLGGGEVQGYKLVLGKKGNRAWIDEALAEEALKSMRLKDEEMYTKNVISPTTAEKIFGEKGTAPSSRRWSRLTELITQRPPVPVVASAGDKKEAYVPVKAEEFPTEEEQ